MKAKITELWETGREILTTDEGDITTIKDVRKCSNVILGEKLAPQEYEAIIGEAVVTIVATTADHCGGNIRIIEVYP